MRWALVAVTAAVGLAAVAQRQWFVVIVCFGLVVEVTRWHR